MVCYFEHIPKLHIEALAQDASPSLRHCRYAFLALTHQCIHLSLPSGRPQGVSSLSVAVGPVAPPVASGAVLTSADFKQCGGNPTSLVMGAGMSMSCNPGTTGRYMYIYINLQTPTNIRICDVLIAGTRIESKY